MHSPTLPPLDAALPQGLVTAHSRGPRQRSKPSRKASLGLRLPFGSAWGPIRWFSGRPAPRLGPRMPGSFPSALASHVNRTGDRFAGAHRTACLDSGESSLRRGQRRRRYPSQARLTRRLHVALMRMLNPSSWSSRETRLALLSHAQPGTRLLPARDGLLRNLRCAADLADRGPHLSLAVDLLTASCHSLPVHPRRLPFVGLPVKYKSRVRLVTVATRERRKVLTNR